MNSRIVSRFLTSTVMVLVISPLVSLAGTDATNSTNGEWDDHKWSRRVNWSRDNADADGRVSFSGKSLQTKPPTFSVDKTDICVESVDFNQFVVPFVGNPIRFSGSSPCISSEANPGAELRVELRGADENSKQNLYKIRWGTLTIVNPVANFAALVVRRGGLIVTNASGTVFANGPALEIGQGYAEWRPTTTEGAEVAASVNGDLRSGRGEGRFIITKGNAAKASLTFKRLDLTPGGMLQIVPSGGSAALGDTERIFFEEAPTLRNGVLPPNIYVQDVASVDAKRTVKLLTYDAENGLTVYAGEIPELVAGQANGLAKITTDTILTANTSVGTLVIENDATLKTESGVTLSIGGDGQPAGIVYNSAANKMFAPTGTIDFASSHGVIVHNNAGGGNQTRISTLGCAVKGTAGVTFAAARTLATNGSLYLQFKRANCLWGSPTVIVGLYTTFAGDWGGQPVDLPTASDVWALGLDAYWTKDENPASLVWYRDFKVTQNLHLSGQGYFDSDNWICRGAIHMGANTRATLSGTTTLEAGVVTLNNDNPTCGQIFKGPIVGPGSLSLQHGMWDFCTTNDYEGTTELTSTSWFSCSLYVKGAGTFGRRKVTVPSPSQLFFEKTTGSPIVAPIVTTSSKPVKFTTSIARLMGENSLNKVEFGGISNRVEIGSTTKIGSIANAGDMDVFSATTNGAQLVLGTGDVDVTLAADVADGKDGEHLVVRKVGLGTLSLAGRKTGAATYDVQEGTLKQADLFKTASYWLDGADESSIKLNDSGRVTNWVSKVGTVSFKKEVSNNHTFAGPDYTNTWTIGDSSRRVLSFASTTEAQRLMSATAVKQATVFIVNRPLPSSRTTPSIFGWLGQDCGQRAGYNCWFSDICAWDFVTTAEKSLGLNGAWVAPADKKLSVSFEVGKPQVLTMVHREYAENTAYSRTSPAIFTASLGGYFNTTDSDGFYRSYRGEIAEVIAFPYVLADDEIKIVENYLSEKWLGKTLHDNVKATPTLADCASVFLADGAKLDLNGRDLTLASLDGIGMVTNSSTTAATLTMAGGNFSGNIGGAVTLSRPAGDVKISVDGANAGLTLNGGSSTLEPSSFNTLTVTNGLSFWVDASYKPEETMATNAIGGVTNWVCRGGKMKRFGFVKDTSIGVWSAPTYDATGFNGKPSVSFVTTNELRSASKTMLKTFFFVATCKRDQPGNAYAWGPTWQDSGNRYSGVRTIVTSSFLSFVHSGETIRLNGVDKTGSSSVAMPEYFVLVERKCDWGDNSLYDDAYISLGRHSNHGGAYECVAEVIGYDRILSDEEMLNVEKYLLEKWVRSPYGQFPLTPTSALTGGAALTLVDGARLTCDGDLVLSGTTLTFDVANATSLPEPLLNVAGSLTLTDVNAEFLNYRSLTPNVDHLFLSVGGVRTGDFASDNLTKGFERAAHGSGETIGHTLGMMLIVR